ncbi:MAG: hypothetical protein GF331_05385 [Chitinivibrionales bacterium]|nr:hypothetical protein [Chitinivibrionales bacterium]
MYHYRPTTLYPRIRTAIVALSCVFAGTASAQTAEILTEPRQTIKGWGAWPAYCRSDWGSDWHIFDKPHLQSLVYESLGINYVRVDIQPRFYDCHNGTLNETALNDMVEHLRIAQSKGVSKWIVSVWSPPCCMKTPGHIDGRITEWTANKTDCVTGEQIPVGTVTSLNPQKVDQFCDYLVDVLMYLQDRGLGTPDNISPQNEPLYDPGYDGCVYNTFNMEKSNRLLYHQVIKTLRSKLDHAGLTTVKVLAPEGNHYGHHPHLLGTGFSDLETDLALRDAVGAIGTHSYDQWGQTVGAVRTFVDGARTYDKEIWMTEWCAYNGAGTVIPDDSELSMAIWVTRHFIREMVLLTAEYWFWWQAYNKQWTPMDGEALIMGTESQPVFSRLYYLFSRIWNTVRPGSLVYPMSSSDVELIADNTSSDNIADSELWFNMVAFESDTNQAILLVNHTTTHKQLALSGVKVPSLNPFVMDQSRNMEAAAPISVTDGSASIRLPQRSVVLLTGTKSPTGLQHRSPEALHRSSVQHSANDYVDLCGRKIPASVERSATGVMILNQKDMGGAVLKVNLSRRAH